MDPTCHCQVVSPSFPVAMVGRVLVGLGVGLGLAIDPLYISEIAPAKHRGQLVSFSEIAINLGIM
jgi:MFS family permease